LKLYGEIDIIYDELVVVHRALSSLEHLMIATSGFPPQEGTHTKSFVLTSPDILGARMEGNFSGLYIYDSNELTGAWHGYSEDTYLEGYLWSKKGGFGGTESAPAVYLDGNGLRVGNVDGPNIIMGFSHSHHGIIMHNEANVPVYWVDPSGINNDIYFAVLGSEIIDGKRRGIVLKRDDSGRYTVEISAYTIVDWLEANVISTIDDSGTGYIINHEHIAGYKNSVLQVEIQTSTGMFYAPDDQYNSVQIGDAGIQFEQGGTPNYQDLTALSLDWFSPQLIAMGGPARYAGIVATWDGVGYGSSWLRLISGALGTTEGTISLQVYGDISRQFSFTPDGLEMDRGNITNAETIFSRRLAVNETIATKTIVFSSPATTPPDDLSEREMRLVIPVSGDPFIAIKIGGQLRKVELPLL